MNTGRPTTFIIFGGTGDLSKKKLFSALLDLYVLDHLPKAFRVVGFSREKFSHEEYREFVREALSKKGHTHAPDIIETFLSNWYFKTGDLLQTESYEDLKGSLVDFDDEIGQCPNRLFYLAVSPSLYDAIFENVAKVKLNEPCGDGWTRILVEKPFGRDLDTAKALDKKLGELFSEDQIYRIDHYLAKNAIQNIIAFRFSNTLFENSWNKDHVERIHILLRENTGIEGRGSFYSATGALRDIGQNHLLQLLALIAMENPGSVTQNALQKARGDVLDALHIHSKDEMKRDVLRAQFSGYKEVDGVEGEGCATETYFMVKSTIDSDRWRDVPIVLESGKGLSEDRLEITVYFKPMDKCVCGDSTLHGHRNVLTMSLQPDEKVSMQFWTKKPGLKFELESKELSFDFEEGDPSTGSGKVLPDAYEKVLYDAITGDQTLFVSTREVEAAWRFITNIISNWSTLPLLQYEQGSNGPDERTTLLGK